MRQQEYNVDKMFTYLKGYFSGADFNESLRALTYAREKHAGQYRKGNGLPYIVHPLEMACYAVALGIHDDKTLAIILLHDVCEDCGIRVCDLPFSEGVKNGVRYLTLEYSDDEDKLVTKKRYFKSLLNCREALIVKGLDRYMNLSQMLGVFDNNRIAKNVVETDELLLPILKEGKERWPDLSNILFILRSNIRKLNNTLAILYNVYPDDK